ncbi:hypothetical protein AVEN_57447-1 [Araneus ventricosus]|uniref:Uncharacterized protein n=1 Tax=Araneus ventricosus TaxID=182803 RepID=A0A4Y2CWP5_ARAVE|nr:hypothetical protein AVEN_57447-1 [Araneus ventricosus]
MVHSFVKVAAKTINLARFTNYRCCSTACHENLPPCANMVGKRKKILEMGLDAHRSSSLRNQRRIQHQGPSFTITLQKKVARMHVDAGTQVCTVLLCNIALDKSCEPMPIILDNESEEEISSTN